MEQNGRNLLMLKKKVLAQKFGKSFFYAFFYTRHLVIKDLYIGGTKVFRDVGKQKSLR